MSFKTNDRAASALPRIRSAQIPVCRTLILLSLGASVGVGDAMARGGGHGSPDAFRGLYEKAASPTVSKNSSDRSNNKVERGRFGRLFALGTSYRDENRKRLRLKPHPGNIQDLRTLGAKDGSMHSASDADGRDSNIPAGYTFFGQFVDHDITFDTVSSLDKPILDIDSENARSATLDLDSVYGGGPDRTPHLYDLPYLATGAEIAQGRYDLLRRTTVAGSKTDTAASTAKAQPVAVNQTPAAKAPTPGAPTPGAVKTEPAPKTNTTISNSGEAGAINDILGNLGGDDEPAEPKKPAPKVTPKPVEKPVESKPPSGRYARGGVKRDVALIGDPRNDENVVISQLQAGFIAFHNRLVDLLLAKDGVDLNALKARVSDATSMIEQRKAEEDLFKVQKDVYERARKHAIHYYHRVIVNDFLPRIIGLNRTQKIRVDGRRFYFPKGFVDKKTGRVQAPYIPVEFSVAAYRYGHSQVRNIYHLSKHTRGVPLFGRGDGPKGTDMMGFKPMTKDLMIDWRYYFPYEGARQLVQSGRPINTSLPTSLFKLIEGGIVPPGDIPSLASRNLMRGQNYFLPSGQALAHVMKIPKQEIIAADKATRDILKTDETPLWYYILQEAKQQGVELVSAEQYSVVRATRMVPSEQVYKASLTTDTQQSQVVKTYAGSTGGDILGPVGGTIVGEVLLGLIENYRAATGEGLDFPSEIDDQMSRSTLPGIGEVYQMSDLLQDAGVAQPIP